MNPPAADPGYPEPGKLELIWGDGFMSPGGPAEVARIIGAANLADCSVLDIGCGLGGADVALVHNHAALHVVGVDVQAELIALAQRHAAALGLQNRTRYQCIAPGPLPFADASFDAIFSKDAIIHIADKAALYAEAFRVLRPGGRLFVSDWLRGSSHDTDALVAEFVAAAGHDFHLIPLADLGRIAARTGFADIDLQDRGAWYLGEARLELDRLRGELGQRFSARFGQKAADDEVEFWRVLVRALEGGALSPGHLRARKPTGKISPGMSN